MKKIRNSIVFINFKNKFCKKKLKFMNILLKGGIVQNMTEIFLKIIKNNYV